MYVIDLNGNEYPLQATSTNEKEVNGNQSLTATILSTKVNKKFIADIKEMWRIVDHDNVEHKIIYAKRKGLGRYTPEYEESESNDSTFYYRPTQLVTGSGTKKELANSTQLEVEIKAIPLFFDDFDNDRIYENINKHMTALEAFTTLFRDTNYDFTLVDQFDAVQWEGFGAGETRLETFKRCLERYKCEFRIAGNVIYLERQIGRDTQFQYRHRLNSTNIEEEIDAAEMWTYAKGYGDYGSEEGSDDDSPENSEDWENAKLIEEYTSPLAEIIGIRHAPPIKDGRISRKAKMQEELKELVDESLKISVSADVIDLQKQGYPVAQSEVGDRVFLIDERIGLDDEVRVISQSKTRNWKGGVIDLNITFGSEGIEKRHRSQLTTAAKDIQDLIAGRKKLPYSVLPAAEQNALKALNEARTELIFGSNENGIQGIIAQEKDDPNRLMWINSAGWMISTDGGASSKVAATADGVVADVITAGILNADQVAIMGGDGNSYAYISGAYAEFRGTFKQTWKGTTNTYDIKSMLQNGYLRFRNDSEKSSLYYSWYGISTYVDGVGGDEENESGQTSGSIFWWDKTYSQASPATSGITVYSWGGTAALVSDRHHALVKSRYSTDIESTESNINITPYSDETNRGFTFTKSQDRLDGYLLFGDNNTTGLRFDKSSDGIVQVVDASNTTGGSTEIEAGLGTFNIVRRRSGTNYLSLQNENYFKVGLDADGSPRVASEVISRRTSSNSANVFITDSGTLGRSSSSERYKVNIEKQFKDDNAQLEHSKKILNLDIKKWNDRFETETLCKEIEAGKRLSAENFRLDKYVGLTSEDVQSVGLEEHVENSVEGLEGIEYDRLWIHLIPIIKDQQARIEELEASK